MKFDYIIGNPPYHENRETTKDMPIYDSFMKEVYPIADKVELITPARFLFRAGATLKSWDDEMLNDKHFKVLDYFPNSRDVFPNVDLKGGVAIHYRDKNSNFGPIKTFTSYKELNGILKKSIYNPGFIGLNTIMYPYSTYSLSKNLWNDFPEKKAEVEYIIKNRNNLTKKEKSGKLSNLKIITTNIFDLFPEIFFNDNRNLDFDSICLYGRTNNKRCYKYVKSEYINVAENYNFWKVLVTKVNGTGKLGETLSNPEVIAPGVGYTQSFLGIGSFKSKLEAQACLKYIKSKFSRTLLSILKVTQDNPPVKWKYVPLQDFSENSDIDWSQSISEIDQQLYKKYGLSDEEIEFIETNVKEME